MNWSDEGFLLSKNKYGENSTIVEVFTLSHGKCSGIVYGGTSKKMKNYLQLGNRIYVDLKTKSTNKLGYFKIEIIEPISPFFFDDKKKINCLISSVNILRAVLPEMLSYNSIYILYRDFLNKLKFSNNWIIYYIFWEMNLLKEIGFDMNLRSNSYGELHKKNKMTTVSIDEEKLDIPSFLLENKIYNIDKHSVHEALRFIGRFFERNILIPNNLIYPASRKNLENFYR